MARFFHRHCGGGQQRQHPPPRRHGPGLRMLVLLPMVLLLARAAVARAYDGTDLGATLIKDVEHAPCVRLFHSKGSTGCRTPTHEGTTVPLYYLGGFSAADQRAFQALAEPVGVVLPAALLNGTVLEYLAAHAPRLTAGIIVLEEEENGNGGAPGPEQGGAFSPDVTTPQGQGTPSAALTIGPTHAWNPHGNGIALQDYAFPVVLATGPSAAEVKGWAQHNGGLTSASPYPRYKAKFQFYFGPANAPASPNDSGSDSKKPLTSADCLAWRDAEGQPRPQCLPMGGQSVWASLGGRTGLRTKPTVLLTAAMDGTALFHDRALAANEAAASVLTLLAAVGALSNASAAGRLDLGALEGNIAVALFQADEWGFAGSRRFAQDIAAFTCEVPLAPANASRDGAGACLRPARPSLAFQDWAFENVAHVLALDQVGVLASAEAPFPLTAIYDAAGGGVGAPAELLDALAAAAESMDGTPGAVALGIYDGDGALPPTPLTSLAKAAAGGTGGAGLSGAVLAGYPGPEFLDPAYHSHRDAGARLVNATASLGAAATLVARSAVLLAGGTAAAAGTVQVEEAFVAEMLACLTADWACPRLMAPLRKSEIANLRAYLGRPSMYTPPVPKQRPASFYAGVLASYQGQPIVQTPDGLYGAWPQQQADNASSSTRSRAPSAEGAKVYAVPKPLESFLRPWLAATVSAADPAAFQQQPPVTCARSADCSAGGETCDGGLSTFECLAGVCVCRSLAFYHLALDPGLGATEEPDAFAVLDEGTPNWAEPNWAAIGVSVYPDASRAVESTAVGLGVGVAAASAVLALVVQRALTKGHYFD